MIEQPDTARILAGLRDFQRDSVDFVFRRLFLDAEPTDRFLIADEVGLGKTLVMRGIIAKAIEHLWEKRRRIDIVYICSNADIAAQNVRRLNVLEEDIAPLPRITLLPKHVQGLRDRRVNFVALTPGTSFDFKLSQGMWAERILLYHLLRRHWNFRGSGPLNVLQGWVQKQEWFRSQVRRIKADEEIDSDLQAAFLEAVDRHVDGQQARGEQDVRTRFEDLAARLRWRPRRLPSNILRDVGSVVGELRGLLAAACLEALEPDIIVLDEFQRFKGLLHGEDEAARLAQSLFEYADEGERTKVVLLSATPYKMYTLAQETDEDHYRDFLETVGFLFHGDHRVELLQERLTGYRDVLMRLDQPNAHDRLLEARTAVEDSLRSVMVRTERHAVDGSRDEMLREVRSDDLTLVPDEVSVYLELQRLADLVDHPDVVEYWKSAPYLLNFMQDYEYKRRIVRKLGDRTDGDGLLQTLQAHPELLLAWSAYGSYGEIEPANARLRWLIDRLASEQAWRILWVPPSIPYYQLDGPFAPFTHRQFTKRLIFSSWAVVPRVLAAMVSYDAEQRLLSTADSAAINSTEYRQARSGLLRFTFEADRLTGMPVLGLLYPSLALADLGDPLEIATSVAEGPESVPATSILEIVRDRLHAALSDIVSSRGTGAEDEQWYWVAPILLDLATNEPDAREWLEQPNLAAKWIGTDEDEAGSRWTDHVERAQSVLDGWRPSGPPPRDLVDVLAQLAVAGLGVSAFRALRRVAGDSQEALVTRVAAGQVAWALRTLFNSPEGTAAVRGPDASEPYWRRVLDYCVSGCLQAVLDEYAHMTREAEGLVDKPGPRVAMGVADAMSRALLLRTVSPVVDDLRLDAEDLPIEKQRMRARFALRFGAEQAEGRTDSTREDRVRQAFNSPFWPFVLATTSVGQEGLDFHQYCHAVVHWNLPANPVDLEQREGRVHRYKGHAVRKNVAARFGLNELAEGAKDPWQALFDLAANDRLPGTNDIVPYWVYAIPEGAQIERQVPFLPLSRDDRRLADLKRSLAVYRMVFGQPRQEDLLAYLLRRFPIEQIQGRLDDARIDLSPPKLEIG